MASRFLSPFISFLIAVIHPEHVREQKYPHWGWGLLLAMRMLGRSVLSSGPSPRLSGRGGARVGAPQEWATPCGGGEAGVGPLTTPCGWRAQEPAAVGWE